MCLVTCYTCSGLASKVLLSGNHNILAMASGIAAYALDGPAGMPLGVPAVSAAYELLKEAARKRETNTKETESD